MSNKATGHVWASGLYEGAALLVSLKLADYADDEGWSWPAMSTLGKQTGLAPRSVRRILRQMEKGGLLVVEKRSGRGRVNRYQMQLAGFEAAEKAWKAMDIRSRFASTKAMRESVHLQSVKEDIRSAFLNAVKEDSDDTKEDSDDRKSGHGSPLESSTEPSRENARAREDDPEPSQTAPIDPESWAQMRSAIKAQMGQAAFVAGVSALRLVNGRVVASSLMAAMDVARRHGEVLKSAGLQAIHTDDGTEVAL